jgi:hypothetical protein
VPRDDIGEIVVIPTITGDPLDRITSAAALLGEHEALAPIAEHLLSYPADLIERLTGAENSAGHSVRVEAILARRNALLRRLGETASPVPLAAELKRYFTTAWQRDRVKVTCPYPSDDRRSTLWALFRLWPRLVSVRYLRVILGTTTPD